jgi:hypothetical protein
MPVKKTIIILGTTQTNAARPLLQHGFRKSQHQSPPIVFLASVIIENPAVRKISVKNGIVGKMVRDFLKTTVRYIHSLFRNSLRNRTSETVLGISFLKMIT